MNKFKLNDKVIVKVGKDKGKMRNYSTCPSKKEILLLDNANFITKHIKPSSQNNGRINKLIKKLIGLKYNILKITNCLKFNIL